MSSSSRFDEAAGYGGGWVVPVAERLLDSSTSFAQSSIAAYVAESWEVFHLHLATAIEQLAKAALADKHPTLLADPRGDFDSLLHLSGLGHFAQKPEYLIRTITASEAIQRLGRVVDDYRAPGRRVALLLETRNGIVHLGHKSKAEAEAILGEAAEYVGGLLADLGMTADAYWGSAANLVSEHAKRRLSEIEAAYQRMLQAAKDRFDRTTSSMDESTRAAFLAAVAPQRAENSFSTAVVRCPACGHSGLLTGNPEPTWEPDFDVEGGHAYIAGVYVASISLAPTAFLCRTCGLALDDSLIDFAEFDEVTLGEGDFDVVAASAFFERQAGDEWLGS